MRVAVTGATGFVGRHVLTELARRDCEVIALLRGPDPGDLPGAPRIIACDIADPEPPRPEALGSPDVLLHLAWGGLPNYRSAHHFEVELPAQYRFLSGLLRAGLGGLVCTGTCFEYGLQSGALHEGLPTRPDNAYGMAKDMLRQQLEMLRREVPFNLAWARLFYLHGEGQAAGSILSQLRAAVARGAPRFDMSGGEQLRDYLAVETAAALLVDLALAQTDCGAVNICSGVPISIRRLVETWCHDNGWDIALNLHHYPYPEHEPMAFWGDATKLAGLCPRLRDL